MGAGLFDFLRAFGYRWAVLMSGALSVPFSVAGGLVEGWAQPLLLLLAAVCLGTAVYFVWRRERQRVIELEGLLKPRLTVPELRIVSAIAQPIGEKRDYIQLAVDVLGDRQVPGCAGFCTSLRKRSSAVAPWEEICGENLTLLWSMIDRPTLQASPGIRQYLNVCYLAAHDVVPVAALVPNFLLPRLGGAAEYQFDIALTGDGVPTPTRLRVKVDALAAGNARIETLI